MLIDDIVDYCNKKYTTFGDKCGNGVCSHPTGKLVEVVIIVYMKFIILMVINANINLYMIVKKCYIIMCANIH